MDIIVPKILTQSKAANNNYAVIFCVDNNFLPYAFFAASRILKIEQQRTFDIVICVPDLDAVPITLRDDSQIRFCAINFNLVEGLPFGRLSSATYHKIFLPAVFDKEYDEILYMDADTYLLYEGLNNIFGNLDPNQKIAMSTDISVIEQRTGMSSHDAYLSNYEKINHTYCNAGIILYNTKAVNEINYLSLLFDFAKNNKESLIKHDQTLINTVLNKEIVPLSFLYNYQLIDATIPLVKEFKPIVIHFVGEYKPWNINTGYVGSFYKEYKTTIEQYFSSLFTAIHSRERLQIESRKKRKKYKNPTRETLSISILKLKKKFSELRGANQERKLSKAEKEKFRREINTTLEQSSINP